MTGVGREMEAGADETGVGGWRHSRWVRLLLRIAPWFSLALSLGGALWMKRDQEAAALVAGAVAGTSLAMSLLLWLRRSERVPRSPGLLRVMNVAGVVATQSLAQLPLYFSATFYVLAFAWTPLQMVFLLLFALAVTAVTWDPFAQALLPHRFLGAPLVAFCCFVGLRAALPMLGVPATWSLAVSLLVVGLLTVWDLHLRWPGALLWQRMGASLGLVLGLLALAPTMPPAPLRLVHGGLGSAVEQRELLGEAERFEAGGKLYCFTAVFSPRDTEAVLVHRWSRDGAPLADLELQVTGGRAGGFRTWSRVQATRPGDYRCEVRNRVGQVLGRLTAEVR